MISKFVKTSTSVWDESISSVVFVSDEGDVDEDTVFGYIGNGTVDSVIIDGDEPLRFCETVQLAKRFKKMKLKVKIVTKGGCPESLDDLVGACYADSVRMVFDGSEIDDNMKKTVDVIFDSGVEHEFCIILDKNRMNAESADAICRMIKGAKRLSLIVPDGKGFTKSEISEIGADARRFVRDVKVIGA